MRIIFFFSLRFHFLLYNLFIFIHLSKMSILNIFEIFNFFGRKK